MPQSILLRSQQHYRRGHSQFVYRIPLIGINSQDVWNVPRSIASRSSINCSKPNWSVTQKILTKLFQLVFRYLENFPDWIATRYNCYEKNEDLVFYWILLIILLRLSNFTTLINYVIEIGNRRLRSDGSVIREIAIVRVSDLTSEYFIDQRNLIIN